MKIKKFLSGLLAVLLIFSLTTSTQSANATVATATENGFTINLVTGYLTAYSGPGGDVVIPSTISGVSVKGIESINVFYFNTTLTSITIPSSLIYLPNSSFIGCSNLTAINIDAANPMYSSVDGVLYDHAKTTLTLCPTGKSGSITIPASVTSIYSPLYYCPKLTEIIVDTNNSVYSSENGVLYNKAKTTLLTYPSAKSGSLTIPDGVTTISPNAFTNCAALTAITIPSSIANIYFDSFLNCSNLLSIITDSNNSAYSSENGILYNKFKTSLILCPAAGGSMVIPNTVTAINPSAFSNNNALTSILIPGSVTFIGPSAFSSCMNLTSVYFPGGSAPNIVDNPMIGSFALSNPALTLYYINGSSGYSWSGYGLFSLIALAPDAMAANVDKSALTVGYAIGDSTASVTQNLTLPLTGSVSGSAITWSSNNAAVSTVTGSSIGVVSRPTYESGDANVVLTATITSGGASVTKDFSLVVTKLSQVLLPSLVSITAPAAITGVASGTSKTATALGLPATVTLVTSNGTSPANVVWDVASSSYNPSLSSAQSFTVNGTVSLPLGVVNTNNISLTIAISVSVNQGSSSGGGSNSGSNNGSGSNPGSGFDNGSGSGASSGTANELPKIEGSTIEGWDAISKSISSSTGSITVNMSEGTVIPKELLSALQGKDTEVTLVLANGIEWVINGKDIPNSTVAQFTDIDPNITLNTDSIPADVLSSISGTGDSKLQLTLAYEGSFGFTAMIRFPLGMKNNGKIANLFYYNPTTNRLELQSIGQINKDGDVDLQFIHASDYVIVISDQAILSDTLEQITVKPDQQNLYYGGTRDKSAKLTVTLPTVIEKAVADKLYETSVSYESSNPQVASVTGNGLVSAKKTGKTTITTTVTVDGVKKSFQTLITVKKAYIKLTRKTGALKPGEAFTYQAVGYGVDTQNIIFKTTKKSILVINKKTGAATAKSIGIDYVLASVGDINLKFRVTVN